MPRFDKTRLTELAQDSEKGASVRELRVKFALSNKVLLKYLVQAMRQGLVKEANLARFLIDRTQYDFPENSEARLEAVLCCMNSELKQAVVLVLDRFPRTYWEIGGSLSAITNARLPARPTFSAYCVDTFAPIGFLVHKRYGRGLGLADHYFQLSEQGAKYGQPIAAFSLRYAVEHNLSLYQLLGQTQSSGDSRAPYNRARILEVVSEGHNRIVDLTQGLGLVIEDVRQHLNHLQRLGMLSFDSLNFAGKGVKFYRWVYGRSPEEARTVGELKTLTKDVAKWLYANKVGERNQIAEALNYSHPTHVSSVLVGLVDQGLTHTPFASCDKSRITLSKRARLLSDYTRAVRNALANKSELRDMTSMFEEFVRDRRRFTRYLDAGIEFYTAVSPNLNARTVKERESELRRFVEVHQEREGVGVRPVDAVRALGWTHGTVTRCIRSLFQRGRLVKEREGSAVRYSVCPQ